MPEVKFCACGRPLHYISDSRRNLVEEVIAQYGETMIIQTPQGAWHVPRHYVGLHIVRAQELPALAKLYEWKQATQEEIEDNG